MAVRETTRAPDPVDTAPQPGRRPVTSHSQISTIAIDLFTAKGFDETSVDDIAEAAGTPGAPCSATSPARTRSPGGFRRPSRRDAHTARTDPRRPTHRAGPAAGPRDIQRGARRRARQSPPALAAASGSTCATSIFNADVCGLAAGDRRLLRRPARCRRRRTSPCRPSAGCAWVRRWPHTSSGSPIPTPT